MVARALSHPRFLVIYSAMVTAAFAATVFFGLPRALRGESKTGEFDRIRVHRIDVTEPDGTPRLIIADRAEYPGSFYHGREIERPDRRDSAGMLFINDEGTEDGGLIYGGATSDGKRQSFSHLSFDQYEQDQTVVVGTALFPDGGDQFPIAGVNPQRNLQLYVPQTVHIGECRLQVDISTDVSERNQRYCANQDYTNARDEN